MRRAQSNFETGQKHNIPSLSQSETKVRHTAAMPLTDIVAKMTLANKENKAEARDGLTPDKEIAADAPLKVIC